MEHFWKTQQTAGLARATDFDPYKLKQRTDDLADRIAAVLEERRKIAEERKRKEQAYRTRTAEHIQSQWHKRGEPRRAGVQTRKLEAILETVLSSNAADSALKEYTTLQAL